MSEATETHKFEAEVNQLLRLVINSLYSNREIFLRELISNASDALDKVKFESITQPDLLGQDSALEIRIIPDVANGLVTIEDNGIGMSHDELAKNLGTIAHSGSRAFLEKLGEKSSKDLSLIGQFGVGFYSAYLVAEKVEVSSRAAGSEQAWRWTSEAKESFTLEPCERSARGTSIVLHLKADAKDYAQEWELRELVTKYSDFVSHPIKLLRKDDKQPEGEWVTLNRANALWQRSKQDLTDEQYTEFYKHLTHDSDAPLLRTHFRVEGNQEFVGLLYLPAKKPWDLDQQQTRRGIRLFVKRVFIMDNCEELIPQWLRFLRGVLDSDDLPLNVSREILQDSATVRAMRKQVIRKTLELLEQTADDQAETYTTFWKQFGPTLKEGLALDFEYRERLAKLLRYESSTQAELTSLEGYVSRMKEGQEAIYYVYGESRKVVEASPHLEALRKKGYEVLFMTDPVDEWAADGLREFQGKKLLSAMRAELKLESNEEEKKAREEQGTVLKTLLGFVEKVLGDKVSEVRLSERLTDSPCCLVVPEGGAHAYMERLLRERAAQMPTRKRIFELNPHHPLVENLRSVHGREGDSERVQAWIETLYDQALLTEGSPLEDPQRFARRVSELLQTASQQVLHT